MRTALVIGLLALGGCTAGEDDTPRFEVPARDDAPAQTDALEYTLAFEPNPLSGGGSYEASAVVQYVNEGTQPVYFARCDPDATGPIYDIARTAPDAGSHFVGESWACVGGVPTGVVPPGESLTFAVWLGSTESPDAMPPIEMRDRTGLFRVELQLYSKYSDDDSARGSLLPVEARQSNAFAVLTPDR